MVAITRVMARFCRWHSARYSSSTTRTSGWAQTTRPPVGPRCARRCVDATTSSSRTRVDGLATRIFLVNIAADQRPAVLNVITNWDAAAFRNDR